MYLDGSSDCFMRKHIDVRIHGFSIFKNLNLKNELRLPEQRIQHLLRTDHIRLAKIFDAGRTVARSVSKDVPKTTTGLQLIGTKREREFIDQKRPVSDTQTVIKSDVVTNAILKQYQLQRLCPVKAQVVYVNDGFDPLC